MTCFGVRKIRNRFPLPTEPEQYKGPVCRHCKTSPVSRPRGLCWNCYYTPGVLDLYPITSKFARKGAGQGHRCNAPLPAAPTCAEPGSEEKIRVLAERAERGEQLHHPDDVGGFGSSGPWTAPLVRFLGGDTGGNSATSERLVSGRKLRHQPRAA